MEEGTFLIKRQPTPRPIQSLTGKVSNCKGAVTEFQLFLKFSEKYSKPKGIPGAANDRRYSSTLCYQKELQQLANSFCQSSPSPTAQGKKRGNEIERSLHRRNSIHCPRVCTPGTQLGAQIQHRNVDRSTLEMQSQQSSHLPKMLLTRHVTIFSHNRHFSQHEVTSHKPHNTT